MLRLTTHQSACSLDLDRKYQFGGGARVNVDAVVLNRRPARADPYDSSEAGALIWIDHDGNTPAVDVSPGGDAGEAAEPQHAAITVRGIFVAVRQKSNWPVRRA